MRKILTVTLAMALFVSLWPATPALAAAVEAGKVTRLQNKAEMIRQLKRAPLKVGAFVRENDRISTGPDARVEITFRDDTRLTIGENSELVIDKYLFDPDKGIGTTILYAAQGPFRFISGKIGKMLNKNVAIKIPLGMIGVRGTDFWGGPSRGVYGVLLLDGAVSVFTDAGGRLITEPGTGVNITSRDAPPSGAVIWGATRVDEALESVTFK